MPAKASPRLTFAKESYNKATLFKTKDIGDKWSKLGGEPNPKRRKYSVELRQKSRIFGLR